MHELNALKLSIFFQCAVVTIILALALISGGIASAVNASDIQEEYIDPLESFCDQGDLIDEEICYKLQAIRDAQAASAVSSIT